MKCFENYPFWFILVSNAISISAYLLGLYVILFFGVMWALIYLAYCIFLEIRLLNGGCTSCYYYGKLCCFGKGKLSALLFKRSSRKFTDRKITWVDVLPDFLVTLIPIFSGIFLLLNNFEWTILAAIILLFLITFVGNAFVRGSLACKFCKQRKLGCPATELFGGEK